MIRRSRSSFKPAESRRSSGEWIRWMKLRSITNSFEPLPKFGDYELLINLVSNFDGWLVGGWLLLWVSFNSNNKSLRKLFPFSEAFEFQSHWHRIPPIPSTIRLWAGLHKFLPADSRERRSHVPCEQRRQMFFLTLFACFGRQHKTIESNWKYYLEVMLCGWSRADNEKKRKNWDR